MAATEEFRDSAPARGGGRRAGGARVARTPAFSLRCAAAGTPREVAANARNTYHRRREDLATWGATVYGQSAEVRRRWAEEKPKLGHAFPKKYIPANACALKVAFQLHRAVGHARDALLQRVTQAVYCPNVRPTPLAAKAPAAPVAASASAAQQQAQRAAAAAAVTSQVAAGQQAAAGAQAAGQQQAHAAAPVRPVHAAAHAGAAQQPAHAQPAGATVANTAQFLGAQPAHAGLAAQRGAGQHAPVVNAARPVQQAQAGAAHAAPLQATQHTASLQQQQQQQQQQHAYAQQALLQQSQTLQQ